MTDTIEAAIRKLIDNHRCEFDDLVREQAADNGELAQTPFTQSIMAATQPEWLEMNKISVLWQQEEDERNRITEET